MFYHFAHIYPHTHIYIYMYIYPQEYKVPDDLLGSCLKILDEYYFIRLTSVGAHFQVA